MGLKAAPGAGPPGLPGIDSTFDMVAQGSDTAGKYTCAGVC